jgi:N-acetylglucosamine-6-phosphate deacetylase
MTARRLGVRAALVDGALIRGDVEISEGRVAAVGCSPAGHRDLAIPGYVDLQVNGFGGVDFLSADETGYEIAGQALVRYGVTAYQPTLVSSPIDVTVEALRQLAKVASHGGPRILGAHLEGPFISPRWKGAHDERFIIEPDLDVAERLCQAGPVTYLTIAPELPGGFELLDWLVARGIVVSVGHTDADAAVAHRAFNRGARAVTHLHNAQRRFAARDPGISGVAQARDDVAVKVIADFVHLARETVHIAWRCARSRLVLVTDAISAAGVGEGTYRLGDRTIYVTDAARLEDGTLAGSVLTMDRAVRNLAELGIPVPEAVHAATAAPAQLIGRHDLGSLRPCSAADIAVLDDSLAVLRTVVEGEELWRAH